MITRFSLYSIDASIHQVVKEIQTGKTMFYVVIRDQAAFTVTTLPVLKSKLAACADDFGAAALEMTLDAVVGLWSPQVGVDPRTDSEVVLKDLSHGECLPVVDGAALVGVLAKSSRSIGSSALGTMYGPRFAIFQNHTPGESGKPPPTRTCPSCSRAIDFYQPKRIGNRIERHCPRCDALITETVA